MPDETSGRPKSKVVRSRAVGSRSKSPGQVIPTADQAHQAAKELHAKLVGRIDAAAPMRVNHRRATVIDRIDFEGAFDDIVTPARRTKQLAFIGDVCGICGEGLVGYSINVDTGSGSGYQVGHIAILAGLILSVAGACLKYLDPSR